MIIFRLNNFILFGEKMNAKLKKYREKHNYSIEELACFFNDNENLIADWESGTVQPTISECIILSKLYGVSLDEMFSGFDISVMLPPHLIDKLEYQAKLNRMVKRWYN